jgi:transcriptional antiterminator NusG
MNSEDNILEDTQEEGLQEENSKELQDVISEGNSESEEVSNFAKSQNVESKTAVVEVATPVVKEKNPNVRWYVINAHSGFEGKVKRTLEDRIRQYNMEHLFGDIQVPQETVVELVKGQKKTSNRKFFPGYVLVEMVLNEDTWHLVKETPKVSGFVGDKTNPLPISEAEAARILNQVEEGAIAPTARIKFQEGETVKVTDGPFSDFNGTVEEVNTQKGKLKVLISIFGRATPVELDFVQVEKLQA